MTAQQLKEIERLDRAARYIRRTAIALLVIATAILIAGCVSNRQHKCAQSYKTDEKSSSVSQNFGSEYLYLQADEIILPVDSVFPLANSYICNQIKPIHDNYTCRNKMVQRARLVWKPPDSVKIKGLKIEKKTCYSGKDSVSAAKEIQVLGSNTQTSKTHNISTHLFYVFPIVLSVMIVGLVIRIKQSKSR